MTTNPSPAAPQGNVRADVTDKYDDYSLRTVPESQIKSTWDIALVRMGVTVSASDLVFGYTLGLYFSFTNALLIAVAYSAIIAVISILLGIIGVRERTTFVLSSRFAFGREGNRLPSLVMAVIIAAFYGYILGITVDVFPKAGLAGQIGYSVGLGIIFLIISGLGFERGLKWVGRIGVPLMIILVVVAVIVGYALPAIPAIIIADYFIVQRMRYPAGLSGLPAVNWRAIAAFFLTIGINLYLGLGVGDTLWHSLPLIGGVLYILLSLPQMRQAWGSRPPEVSKDPVLEPSR